MNGHDQYFYDITTYSYTFYKWSNDLTTRYGGIDSFLFWMTYSNLVADDRNQFDMNCAIPAGIQSLTLIIHYFHQQSPPINVLFPYSPWDQRTLYSGLLDYKMKAKFLNESGADGFNGDTINYVPQEFYIYSVDAYNHPIAICPDWRGTVQSMNWDTLG